MVFMSLSLISNNQFEIVKNVIHISFSKVTNTLHKINYHPPFYIKILWRILVFFLQEADLIEFY